MRDKPVQNVAIIVVFSTWALYSIVRFLKQLYKQIVYLDTLAFILNHCYSIINLMRSSSDSACQYAG